MSGAFILDFLAFALHHRSIREGGSVVLIRDLLSTKKSWTGVDINYSTSPVKVTLLRWHAKDRRCDTTPQTLFGIEKMPSLFT